MEGLAQQGMQQEQTGMPTVQEIAQLLLQGVPPEKILEAGVPQELIQQAVQMVQTMYQQNNLQERSGESPESLQQERMAPSNPQMQGLAGQVV